jgi:cytochrome c-type biogenesis protein CcmE
MKPTLKRGFQGRGKFIIGGGLVLAAVVYLIVASTRANAQYFKTVDELRADPASLVGQNLRISGAVDGSTIQFDPDKNVLTFQIANVPGDNATIEAQGGLSKVLHDAVKDPKRARLTVVYNGPKPDLLRDEAQAIVTGHLGADGIFYADPDGLLLKCPTKYQEAVPSQASGN